jgi:TolB-like protein
MTSETSLKYRIAAYRGDEPFAFFSYSHDDSALVFVEFEALSAAGIRFYYDEGIHPGHTWHDELAKAIARCAVFVLFVTARSVASRNCQRELAFALDNDKPVVAVHLEDTSLPSGVRLAIGDRQAIIRSRFEEARYREQLIAAIREHIGALGVPPVAAVAPIVKQPYKRRRALFAAVVVAIAALAVTLLWHREPTNATAPAIAETSVAILPFVAMSEDASLRHLGEGLSEQITNRLANRRDLTVASRTSAFDQGGKTVVEIARDLRVSYVLEGSVRQTGENVRATAQLVRGDDGMQLFSEAFDIPKGMTTELDQTATLVTSIVVSTLHSEDMLRHARTQTHSREAFERYAAATRLRFAVENGRATVANPMQVLDDLDRGDRARSGICFCAFLAGQYLPEQVRSEYGLWSALFRRSASINRERAGAATR